LRHRVCSLSRGRSARESTAGSIRRSGPVACMRTAPLGAFSTVVLKYTVGMAIGERTLSEFLQHSGRVLAALAEGGLVLRRRDGEDLVVRTRGHHAALNTVLRTFVAVQQGDVAAAEAVLPWLAFLSPADRRECLRELGTVAAAAVTTGQLARLQETLYAWEASG